MRASYTRACGCVRSCRRCVRGVAWCVAAVCGWVGLCGVGSGSYLFSAGGGARWRPVVAVRWPLTFFAWYSRLYLLFAAWYRSLYRYVYRYVYRSVLVPVSVPVCTRCVHLWF